MISLRYHSLLSQANVWLGSANKYKGESTSIVQSIRSYANARRGIPILQTLLGAASKKSENLLPAMGIPTHTYTEFIYRLIIFGDLDPADGYNEMFRSRDHLQEIHESRSSTMWMMTTRRRVPTTDLPRTNRRLADKRVQSVVVLPKYFMNKF